MPIYPPALARLIQALTRLPGIGPKSATRLALFLLRAEDGLSLELAQALTQAKKEVHPCPICFNLTDQEVCPLCADPGRDSAIICVVEGPADLAAVEKAGAFKGRYHVLGGLLSPLDKIGPVDLKISQLLARVKKETIREVILATSPTSQGEATAAYLAERLKQSGIKVSRIAFGLPMGADIEYADPVSLKASLEGRKET